MNPVGVISSIFCTRTIVRSDREGIVDRRKKIIANKYEAAVHDAISNVAQQNGCVVYPKVRIADALNIDRSGLDNPAYSYALKSHFDFLVADGQSLPAFAVEFDGPSHETPDGRRKDCLKNGICETLGLPLLRVTAAYLEEENETMSLLAWLADLWFMSEAFFQAQENGSVPDDESFGYAFSSVDYFRGYRAFVWAAHRDGRIKSPPITCLHTFNEDTGRYVACLLLELPDGNFVVGEASCARNALYPIDGDELVSELALVDSVKKFIRLQYRTYTQESRAAAEACYLRYASLVSRNGLKYGFGSGPFPKET